jgi:hypothetical protein
MTDPVHRDAAAMTPLPRRRAGWLAGLRALVESRSGAVLGAGVYAAWATAVNWDAGAAVALRAGAFHWVASALLTYWGTQAMRRCFAFGTTPPSRALSAFCGGMGLTYGVLFAVHGAIGTPHIALALAAGVLPTVAFCAGYAALLLRTAQACPNGARPC